MTGAVISVLLTILKLCGRSSSCLLLLKFECLFAREFFLPPHRLFLDHLRMCLLLVDLGEKDLLQI